MTLSFSPCSGKHAIETCTIVIRFFQPIDQQTFAELVSAAKKIAAENDLPASHQFALPPMLVEMGMQFAGQQAGHIFQRFASNGQVEAELKCDLQSLTLQVRTYDGWEALTGVISRLVMPLIEFYVGTVPAISSVTMQYDDRFSGLPGARASAGELFREGSPWVTIYDRSTLEAWHSHFGIFLPCTNDRRELVNVNVNVNDGFSADGATHRNVALTIMVAEAFDIPGRQPLIFDAGEAKETVTGLLELAHLRHRQILQEVLADTYLEAIGAKASL